ncbi:MAG TPA: hypothetical protein VIY29_15555 [Ktedonobacteraceae bacterium]
MQPAVPEQGAGEPDEAEGVAWLLAVADEDRPAFLQPGKRHLDQAGSGRGAACCQPGRASFQLKASFKLSTLYLTV